MPARLALLLAVGAALVAGCGAEQQLDSGSGETATLWVTRDRGSEVLIEAQVAAGQTVLQALHGQADVETRHGGRFVQAIDGLAGSLADGRDWFFFVNGLAADRGASEYRLRPGEVAWWDYRRWAGEDEVHAVVGAFPEPFVHGYDGEVRAAVVTFERPDQEDAARSLARVIGAERVVRAGRAPPDANVLALADGPERFTATAEHGVHGPVRFELAGDAAALARNPARYRFRFEVRP
jgi:hypothetical protein